MGNGSNDYSGEYQVFEGITKKEYAQVLIDIMLKMPAYSFIQLMSEGEQMIYQLKRTDKEKPTVEQVLKAPWDKAERAKVIGSGGTPKANEDTQYHLVRLLQGFGVFE